MKAQLFLRSYGDYVVALASQQILPTSSSLLWIVSDHLKPLHEALTPHLHNPQPSIHFLPLGIKKGLLSFFTNKYFYSTQSLRELWALRQSLHILTKKQGLVNLFLVEQFRRKKLLGWFTGQSFEAVHVSKTTNIYESYNRFWHQSQALFFKNPVKPIIIKRIVIFPNSRKPEKEMPQYLLDNIINYATESGFQLKVAFFNNKQPDTNRFSIYYKDFPSLVKIIEENDFVISTDSLPAHIAQFIQKPHWIFYNKKINYEWLTPWAMQQKTYGLFNDLKLLETYINSFN